MTKEELLKLLHEAPELTLIEIRYAKLDRAAREFLWLNDPVQVFQERMKDKSTDDSQMLIGGVNYLATQLTIVLLKRGVDPRELKRAPFSARVRLAKELSPPLEPPALIPRLEALNEIYVMTHDTTLVDFSQEEWKNLIEKMKPEAPKETPNYLRMRVHVAMHISAINLDELGGNSRD